MTVYCLVELDRADGIAGGTATVSDASLRALTLSRALSRGTVAVVFAAEAEAPVAELAAHGVTEVLAVKSERYAPLAWARALAALVADLVPGVVAGPDQAGPDQDRHAVIAAGTDHGNEVLAHLGAITGLPMAANCLSASAAAGGGLDLVRQRWAGLLLEEATLDGPVALLTVATDAPSPAPAAEPAPVTVQGEPTAVPVQGERAAVTVHGEPTAVPVHGEPTAVTVHTLTPSLQDGDLVIRADEEPAGTGGASLATARVVVGGGRGVGSAEGFAQLEELAALLGGVVGVSRVVTSEGWRPHTQQVGQTGTKITPDLYLACGISGAIQHIAGCSGARHIIAINTDPAAPMMSRAHYAVVGDLHQVIPALIAALRDR